VSFDPVHDLQAAFRTLLDAFARPGTVHDLAPIARRLPGPEGAAPRGAWGVVTRALLDADAPFAVAADAPAGFARAVREATGAPVVPLDDAGHVLVPDPASDPAPLLRTARRGTLEDPHLGATVLLAVERLYGDGDAPRGAEAAGATGYRLEGPGVDGVRSVWVAHPHAWAPARDAAVADVPLGVDVLLLDAEDRIAAIPRSSHPIAGGGP
jgi:alpha-D-ribose 1-methylphosphonate 5-triphosphate synthase subunit PhnH